MAFISETLQMRRLTESGVNIKTTYIVDGTLRYRSTTEPVRMMCTVVSDAAKSISGRGNCSIQRKSSIPAWSIPMYPEWMKRHSIPVRTVALPAR